MNISLYDEAPNIAVERSGDKQDVTLTIEANGASIELNVGHIYDDVAALRDALQEMADDITKYILAGWIDTPEKDDVYIWRNPPFAFQATVARKQLGDGYGFPTLEIACYEAAKAMLEDGHFFNEWLVDEHGDNEPINDQVRALIAGDEMVPLVGANLEDGTRVRLTFDDVYVVVHDYGQYGVTLHIDGDPSIREFVPANERHQLRPIADDNA